MRRFSIQPRQHWQALAHEYGFEFHTMYGESYWDESAYYRLTLEQIEQHIEAPTQEIHHMCLAVVDKVIASEQLLEQCKIPEQQWQLIYDSWARADPSLYSRIDLAYNGQAPAKLYENNADTPTSVYETGFWQWLWLEDQVNMGHLPKQADQFNSLQEKLMQRFAALQLQEQKKRLSKENQPELTLYFGYCQQSLEDKGTVQYLADCARAVGISTALICMEDIGLSEQGFFTDLNDQAIQWLFKLYPWEFMFAEDYGRALSQSQCRFLEPAWKAIVSNKALLPLLWQTFPNHPHLLEAYFEDDVQKSTSNTLVKKPFFSREGANISILHQTNKTHETSGPYGEEGFIYQAYHPLPKFGPHHTLIGSWLVNDQAAGMAIREDHHPITQDMSRFVPHIII